ncbi:MAG: Ig-like domain-containing protein [Polyangiaceae bacterium]
MVRSIYRLGLVVALATIATACGDGGSSSNGGNGGGGSTTTSSTSSSSSSSSGGTGGDTGGTGGSTGGTTTGGGGATTGGGGATTGGGGTGGSTGGTTSMGGTGGTTSMGGTGGSTGGMGGMGGSMPTGGSDQIAAVRASADGSVPNMPIQGVFVTYTKPVLGQDAAGFFVQGEAAGPAIFVAVDPTTLNPPVQIGDEVDLTVTDVVTTAGLKAVTGLGMATVVTSGNPIDPLVTDVSAATDLVSGLDMYESRAIKITGSLNAAFISAGAPQVATPIQTMGMNDPNLRLRMPETIRAQYGLGMGCNVTANYGVMWRFNAVAQPSVYNPASLMGMSCAAPTVLSAVPLSATEVIVNFDRPMDPATIDVADFAFDNGLTAMAVAPNGSSVTVTTTPDQAGLVYTVTVSNVNDVLGTPLGMPNSAMFQSYVPIAQLLINELSPNITTQHDLIELVALTGGSVNGIKLLQKGSATETLVTLPDFSVAQGDFIVIHLVPSGVAGIAPASETMSKTQYANGMYSANYDTAWDILGGATGLTFGYRVLELDGPAGTLMDAVPVVVSNQTGAAAFPGVLQALQAAGGWLPADCGGALCTYASTPTATTISVDYMGAGTTPNGKSIQRKPGMNTKMNTDWNGAANSSFGAAN